MNGMSLFFVSICLKAFHFSYLSLIALINDSLFPPVLSSMFRIDCREENYKKKLNL